MNEKPEPANCLECRDCFPSCIDPNVYYCLIMNSPVGHGHGIPEWCPRMKGEEVKE